MLDNILEKLITTTTTTTIIIIVSAIVTAIIITISLLSLPLMFVFHTIRDNDYYYHSCTIGKWWYYHYHLVVATVIHHAFSFKVKLQRAFQGAPSAARHSAVEKIADNLSGIR